MFYLGVQVDIEGEGAEEALSQLPFFTLYKVLDGFLLGVIELKDPEEWSEVQELVETIPGVKSLTILSSVFDES